jgi:hypothetical protein
LRSSVPSAPLILERGCFYGVGRLFAKDYSFFDPMNPENAKGQIIHDGDRCGQNYVRMQQEYLDCIAS